MTKAGGLEGVHAGIVTDPLRVMVVADDMALRLDIGNWVDRERDCAVILSRRCIGGAAADAVAFDVELLLIDVRTAAVEIGALGLLARSKPALQILTVYPDAPGGPIVSRFGTLCGEAAVAHGPGALRFAILSAIREHSGRTEWRGAPPVRPDAPKPARLWTAPILNA